TAQVHIILGCARNVLLVPSDALRNETKERKAWVQLLVDRDKVITKQVTVGLNNKVMAEIVSGLNEGDVVVVGARDGLLVSSNLQSENRV
ncbi:MAG: efflux transporter periplasmic adaptor subunit, partial [Bartonella sp.]|nr:efflux transporter periplasmic adaptor subunit [Bartonella sp.]